MGEPVTTAAGGVAVEQTVESVPAGWATDPPVATAVIPRDGFHDRREVDAAVSAGQPTLAGYPLHPAALSFLVETKRSIAGIRSWCDWAETQIAKAEAIGGG
jgi:hypothetical protein